MRIYKTTNLINQMIYIGQTIKNDPNYYGSGKYFLRALRKYGKENFKVEILVDNINNQLLLDELEKHYIRLHAATIDGIGYNIQYGGKGNKLKKDEYKELVITDTKRTVKEYQNLPKVKEASRQRALKMYAEGKHIFQKMTKEEKSLFQKIAGKRGAETVSRKVLLTEIIDLKETVVAQFDTITSCTKCLNISAQHLHKLSKSKKRFKNKYKVYICPNKAQKII